MAAKEPTKPDLVCTAALSESAVDYYVSQIKGEGSYIRLST